MKLKRMKLMHRPTKSVPVFRPPCIYHDSHAMASSPSSPKLWQCGPKRSSSLAWSVDCAYVQVARCNILYTVSLWPNTWPSTIYRVAQKSEPLPNDQNTVLNRIKACQ